MQTHTHVCSRALWGQPLMWPSAHPAWHLITALSVSHPAQWLHVLELLSLQPLSSLYSITSSILCTSVQYATFQTALSPCGSTECWVNFYLCFMIIGPELSPGVLLLFAMHYFWSLAIKFQGNLTSLDVQCCILLVKWWMDGLHLLSIFAKLYFHCGSF